MRLISERDSPARRTAFGTASTGPMPMISGGTPAVANERKTPRGCRFNRVAFSADITTTAAAPSLVWDELPAVTTPSLAKTGFNFASASGDVS